MFSTARHYRRQGRIENLNNGNVRYRANTVIQSDYSPNATEQRFERKLQLAINKYRGGLK